MKITKENNLEIFELLIEGDPERVEVSHRRGSSFYCKLYQDLSTEKEYSWFKRTLGDKWSDKYAGKWITNFTTFDDSWGLEEDGVYEFLPCETEKVMVIKTIYKLIEENEDN